MEQVPSSGIGSAQALPWAADLLLRHRTTVALCLVAVLLTLLARVSNLAVTLSVAAGFALFAAPGYFLLIACFGRARGVSIEDVIWSLVIGVPVSSLLTLAVGTVGRWTPLSIIAALLVFTAGLALVAARNGEARRWTQEPWARLDSAMLAAFCVLALLVVYLPFSRVGQLTERGVMFPSLFGLDFILRLSFSAALSHGVPPPYLNYSGLTLQTYWGFYVLPGVIHMGTGYQLPLQSIFIVTQLVEILIFLGAFFALVRTLIRNATALAVTMFLLVCAYSYYGLFALLKTSLATMSNGPASWLRSLGVFRQASLLSHSYFRDWLVEPQALAAVCVILFVLRVAIASHAPGLRDFRVALLVGTLTACCFGIDGSIGLIAVAWCGLLLVVGTMSNKWGFRSWLAFGGGVGFVALSFWWLGMYSYDGDASGLRLVPYWPIIVASPAYFLLDYGPMAVFAVWFAVRAGRDLRKAEFLPLLLLGVVCLGFVFFVRHHFEVNLGLRKGMKVLQLPLLVMAGLFVETFYVAGRISSNLRRLIPILVLVGCITLGVDIYSASNATDVENTTFVSSADYNACQWIKANTPVNSVVQSEPEYPSVYEYSLISTFAERAMVVGESHMGYTLHMTDGQKFSDGRRSDVRRMLASEDVGEAIAVINTYGINYIYVGSLEKRLYRSGVKKFAQFSDRFERVYSEDGVELYRVIK